MLSKCANPVCSNPFLYLREGKLFQLEMASPTGREISTEFKKRPHRVEFFWLCEECSASHVLRVRNGEGVQVVLRATSAASEWLVS